MLQHFVVSTWWFCLRKFVMYLSLKSMPMYIKAWRSCKSTISCDGAISLKKVVVCLCEQGCRCERANGTGTWFVPWWMLLYCVQLKVQTHPWGNYSKRVWKRDSTIQAGRPVCPHCDTRGEGWNDGLVASLFEWSQLSWFRHCTRIGKCCISEVG